MSNGASNFATIPDPANLVTLVVNGEEYGGWKAVRIEADDHLRLYADGRPALSLEPTPDPEPSEV